MYDKRVEHLKSRVRRCMLMELPPNLILLSLVVQYSIFFRAVQKWLDNPRHQGVKRDIGELLTPGKYADECDLEGESDEPTASDLDFIDDSGLVDDSGETSAMHSQVQSLPEGSHIQSDSDELSDDEPLLVLSGAVVDDTEESEMGDSANGYSSGAEDNSNAGESSDEECLKQRLKKASRMRGKKPISEYVLFSRLYSMNYVDRSFDSSAVSQISSKMMVLTAMILSLTNPQTRRLSSQVCFLLGQDVEDHSSGRSLQLPDGKRARLPRRKPKKRLGPP